jgi:hypothetical protein
VGLLVAAPLVLDGLDVLATEEDWESFGEDVVVMSQAILVNGIVNEMSRSPSSGRGRFFTMFPRGHRSCASRATTCLSIQHMHRPHTRRASAMLALSRASPTLTLTFSLP